MALQAPYDRKAIEDALHSWLVFGSDLPEASVLLEHQAVPQPVHPYCTFRVINVSRIGGDDEQRQSVDMRREDGQEIELNLCGLRRATVSVNFYARSNVANSDAGALAASAQAALAKDEVVQMLAAADVAIVNEGALQDLTHLESDQWVSRSQFDVDISFASNLPEYVGYIANVVVNAPALGIDSETFPLE